MEDFKITSFVIGEPFPWKEYAKKNVERVYPAMNPYGFDVVISMANLTEEELYAFGHSEAELAFKDIYGVPFVVLNFDDVIKVDFTINIMKMHENNRKQWLQESSKSCMIKVFLIEATTTNLVAIRTLPFEDMPYLREMCAPQIATSKERIDEAARSIESRFDTKTILDTADKRYFFDVINL